MSTTMQPVQPAPVPETGAGAPIDPEAELREAALAELGQIGPHSEERPLYRVLETSYFGMHLLEAGATVHFDHDPGFNLEPMNDAARSRQAAFHDRLTREGEAHLSPKDPRFGYELAKANVQDGVAQGTGPGTIRR